MKEHDTLEVLKKDRHLFLWSDDRLISIFDHTHYDRSDYDVLAPPQRDYLMGKLKSLGYRQHSGRVMISEEEGVRFIFPRPKIISSSPGDILDDEQRGANDFFVLTPTQLAFLMIAKRIGRNDVNTVGELKTLIEKQPINLKKLEDYLKNTEQRLFWQTYGGELGRFQKEMVATTDLASKKHLGHL